MGERKSWVHAYHRRFVLQTAGDVPHHRRFVAGTVGDALRHYHRRFQ